MVDDLTEKKVMCGVSVCKMDIRGPDGICGRPVRIQTNEPGTNILQLEARPSSLSYKCISSGLIREDLLCKPPIGPIVESPVGSQSPTSRCTDSGPSLESIKKSKFGCKSGNFNSNAL